MWARWAPVSGRLPRSVIAVGSGAGEPRGSSRASPPALGHGEPLTPPLLRSEAS